LNAIAGYLPADLTVERIGDLLDYELAALLAGKKQPKALAIPNLRKRAEK
jgi:hypothetical protein